MSAIRLYNAFKKLTRHCKTTTAYNRPSTWMKKDARKMVASNWKGPENHRIYGVSLKICARWIDKWIPRYDQGNMWRPLSTANPIFLVARRATLSWIWIPYRNLTSFNLIQKPPVLASEVIFQIYARDGFAASAYEPPNLLDSSTHRDNPTVVWGLRLSKIFLHFPNETMAKRNRIIKSISKLVRQHSFEASAWSSSGADERK